MGDIKSEEEAVDPGGDLCPLEFFPNELFLNVYKRLDLEAKKAFRLLCKRLRDRSEDHEETLCKDWVLGIHGLAGDHGRLLTPELLIELATQFRVMKGLVAFFGNQGQFHLVYIPVDNALVHLNRTHPELETIELNRAKCTKSGLEALFTMKNIKTVNFKHTSFEISGDLSPDEKYSESIEKLVIYRSPIVSRGLAAMLRNISTNLKHLEISHTSPSFHGVGVDGGILFPNLTIFELKGNASAGDAVRELNLNSLLGSFGQGLKELKLEGISSTANDLTITSEFSFPDLEILELKRDFQHINDQGVLSILRRTKALKALALDATECTLESIGSSDIDFSSLVQLDMSHSELLTETGLTLVMSKVGTELKVLKLVGTNISLDRTSSIPGFLPNLEDLDLSFCPNLSNAAFITFLNKTGENLYRLNLRETPVTLRGISSVTFSFQKLKYIDVSYWYSVEENIATSDLLCLLNKTNRSLEVQLDVANNDDRLDCDAIRELFPNIFLIDAD